MLFVRQYTGLYRAEEVPLQYCTLKGSANIFSLLVSQGLELYVLGSRILLAYGRYLYVRNTLLQSTNYCTAAAILPSTTTTMSGNEAEDWVASSRNGHTYDRQHWQTVESWHGWARGQFLKDALPLRSHNLPFSISTINRH